MPLANNRGIRINYEVEGHGPSLVLHHGFSENLRSWHWKGFVEALQDSYHLILFDARGHGASDKPHGPDAYTLADYASDVVAVLNELEIDRTHYFGYSLGGWTGFGLAQHAAHRIHSLAIGGTHPYGSSLSVYRDMLRKDLEHLLSSIETAAATPLPTKMREAHFGNDMDALRASYQKDRPNISALMPVILMPCLIFAGEADPLYAAIQRCASELQNARFYTLSSLNHIQVALQLNRLLPPLITFLEEVQGCCEKICETSLQ